MQSLSFACSHYVLSNKTLAMQLDGQQSLAISILVAGRIRIIIEQINARTPNLKVRFTVILGALGVGVLGGCVCPLAESYLKKHPHPTTQEDKIFTVACQILTKAGKASQAMLQHADKVLNIACLVHAIALISMGFPVHGSIALCGLSVLALKRYHYLPASIERFVAPISLLGSLATAITMPTYMVLKIIFIADCVVDLTTFLLNLRIIQYNLPARFRNPFHNQHVIEKAPDDLREILNKATDSQFFFVNPTHIYSDEIGRLLPTEFAESLDTIDASELFDQLDTKIKTLDISLSEEEQKGLNNLKVCAVTGRVADTTPTDIELFQKIIKALVQSILNDDDNFTVQVKDFANLGNSCVEGWTRDITTMLSPQTMETAWAVHRVLAKMRGEIIKAAVLGSKLFPLLSTVGGSNNVHTTDAIQVAFWHRFRSFEGELYRQLHTITPLELLILRWFSTRKSTKNLFVALSELFFMNAVAKSIHPGLRGLDILFCSTFLLLEIFGHINDAVKSVDTTVNAMYDAIKPEYQPAADGRVDCLDSKRVIPWKAILAWMNAIAERREIYICDPDTYEYDPRFVERDMAGEYYLSKAGVILLLWDLGILNTR